MAYFTIRRDRDGYSRELLVGRELGLVDRGLRSKGGRPECPSVDQAARAFRPRCGTRPAARRSHARRGRSRSAPPRFQILACETSWRDLLRVASVCGWCSRGLREQVHAETRSAKGV
jgi:hypothetical protein